MNTLQAILFSISLVESNHQPEVFNQTEQAAGYFQIRPIYAADVNRIAKLKHLDFTFNWPMDCKNYEKSCKAVEIYTSYWCRHLGLTFNKENISRIHNGGPRNWKTKDAKRYSLKVVEVLKKRFGAV